ncbi:MAG: Pyridoxal phosphate phosphatase YbhA [Candidatus Erwinia impunctatus]|nr:Pyridoxal phosphate phosphatase YbhA [Culicoides impunctatus]
MRYRVIALDLDGTLLTAKKTILPESLLALNKAREAGVKVILVTGRHHVAIHPFYQTLALNTPAICCNGSYSYDYQTKGVLQADPLSLSQTLQVIDVLKQTSIHGLLYVDDAMLYTEETGHITRALQWEQTLPQHQRPTLNRVNSLEQGAREAKSIWKFALAHPERDELHTFIAQIESKFGLACEWSWIDQVDIAQTGNSKGKRLAQWVESQGYTMNDVVAFGDNYNDISMLERAGLGVAMGNADEAVKQRADIVISNNEEPGIAQLIEERILH